MGLEVKTPGVLIDELQTVNVKLFMTIDRLHDYSEKGRLEEAGLEAVQVHRLNNRRNELIAAIDRVLGFGASTVTDKTYKDLK